MEIGLAEKQNCQYLKARWAGDEVYYWCDLTDHPCVVEYNNEDCEENKEETE